MGAKAGPFSLPRPYSRGPRSRQLGIPSPGSLLPSARAASSPPSPSSRSLSPGRPASPPRAPRIAPYGETPADATRRL